MKNKTQPAAQSITLQHRISQTLFLGCWQARRIGVVQFASVLRCLHQAIQAQDPYAVLFQEQVSDALRETRAHLKDWEATHQQALATCRGIHYHDISTMYPQTFPLTATTPEACQAAFMVVDLDYLLSASRRCQQLGIDLTDKDDPTAVRYTAVQLVQQTLHLPFGWRATGVTSAALLANTPQSQRAAHTLQAALSRPLPTKQLAVKNHA